MSGGCRVIYSYTIQFGIRLPNGRGHYESTSDRGTISVPYRMDRSTIISYIKPTLEDKINSFYNQIKNTYEDVDSYSIVLFDQIYINNSDGCEQLVSNDEIVSYRYNVDNGGYIR